MSTKLGNLCLAHQVGMACEGFDIEGGMTEDGKARLARNLQLLTARVTRALEGPTLVVPVVSRGGVF